MQCVPYVTDISYDLVRYRFDIVQIILSENCLKRWHLASAAKARDAAQLPQPEESPAPL